MSKRRSDRLRVLRVTVTPLASIFGSGFLIIVPVMERVLGSLSIVGTAVVCGLAWVAGTAVRHCVRVVEPGLAAGSLDAVTRRLDRLGDAVIVVAYIISIALYLRILAEYIFRFFGEGSPVGERALAAALVLAIVIVGLIRGFHGLDLLERAALITVLLIVIVLIGVLLSHNAQSLATGDLRLPPGPPVEFGAILLTLGGVVITVQGFETVRYLGDHYDAETRVWASRIAQLVATVIYLALIAVATPLMGSGASAGPDTTLIEIVRRAAPLLALPLVVVAVLSQFSAATADTVAADGNLRKLSSWMRGPRPYLVSGVAAVALAATVPTLTIVVIASRAFAAYYAIQAVLALRTHRGVGGKIGYGALAAVMVAITVLAQPVG